MGLGPDFLADTVGPAKPELVFLEAYNVTASAKIINQ